LRINKLVSTLDIEMKKTLFLFLVSLCFSNVLQPQTSETSGKFTILVHGGAGNLPKVKPMAEEEEAYKATLRQSLQGGLEVLKKGGSSLDAVEKAIQVLEDSPLFNAGKGSVFTADGTNEMDASIMDGSNLRGGAVTVVSTIKNPISAARAVMEKTEHVLLSGNAAEQFAKSVGLVIVPHSYFHTERRLRELREKQKEESEKQKEFSTVGAVALDMNGNLAAGTSTGGRTNKMVGRIGDSPVLGAGNYANNKTCAVSATGHGEYMMRYLTAYDVSALMEYKTYTVHKAAEEVVNKINQAGGSCGLIALDRKGDFSISFNTERMYRAFIGNDGKIQIYLYK
jgi:L-asparaginase / beta-aspartyl-peptidase